MRLVVIICLMLSWEPGCGQFKYYKKGMNAYREKDYAASIENLNRYLDYGTRDKSFDVDVHYYLALCYFKSKFYTGAIREFDEALRLGHQNIGNIHWFNAQAYYELNAFNEASEEYGKALPLIRESKSHAKILYEHAKVLLKLNQQLNAEDALLKAKSLDPSNTEVQQMLVSVHDSKQSQSGEAHSDVSPTAEEKKSMPGDQGHELSKEYKDEKRFALVIGNSNYQYVSRLRNAANDANDMAAELEKSNFEVIKIIDGTYAEMRDGFRRFHDRLLSAPKDKAVGLFYYAGHGLQNEGENYLVPVEANIQYEDDIPRACLAVQRVVLGNMERSNSRMNIVVLDACRNNPFPSIYRSNSTGLAEIKRAKGSFVAFSTAPGSIASDGEGRNGLYTQELLKAMQKPGLTVEQVFKEVRMNVMKLSGEKQITWDQSNIIGDFYFKF